MSTVKFKQWMAASTLLEKKAVAVMATTSLPHLYDVATGRRNASADLAGRLEAAIKAVNKRKRAEPLPVVRRGDISEACAECSFYKRGCE